MNISEKYVTAKKLCNPSKLPASDYVINPYVGCIHGCKYCYAQFMGRFTKHTETWGTYIEPKKYTSYRLPKKLEGKTILIGSVTDAYNPTEKKFCLMPNILKSLIECSAHVEILTKSNLVLRDIELIRKISNISVGISLSNLNEQDNEIIEPKASSAEERIKTLQILHQYGIKTYLFIAPFLPGITNLQNIYESVKDSVNYICVENLNLRGSYKQTMLDIIKKYHPELYHLWCDIYSGKQKEEYWKNIEDKIEKFSKNINIPVISYMYHNKIKKV